ncbi:hypothetical protein [Aquitalea aquatica]|uniref:Uncharacterized protein n=1 Tax=Aquitalea aquatica TaxID=3044273 RepID=A0A838Y1L7_9NEIS|nr:hypothetical protein [Aquitalea magnusonii]MBA4709320.1 hypothetical protein [Aquitalea magnusonii]
MSSAIASANIIIDMAWDAEIGTNGTRSNDLIVVGVCVVKRVSVRMMFRMRHHAIFFKLFKKTLLLSAVLHRAVKPVCGLAHDNWPLTLVVSWDARDLCLAKIPFLLAGQQGQIIWLAGMDHLPLRPGGSLRQRHFHTARLQQAANVYR